MTRFKIMPIELILILLAFGWSVILSLPLPIPTFASSSAYTAMASLASENVWSIGMGVLGLIQFIGMLLENKKIKMVGLMLATLTWTFVGAMIIVSGIMAHTGLTMSGNILDKMIDGDHYVLDRNNGDFISTYCTIIG